MKQPLGRILMDYGFICAKDLNLALLKQMQASEPLGQALVKLGILDVSELSAVAPGILADGGRQSDIWGNILSNDDRILFVNSDGLQFTVLSGI